MPSTLALCCAISRFHYACRIAVVEKNSARLIEVTDIVTYDEELSPLQVGYVIESFVFLHLYLNSSRFSWRYTRLTRHPHFHVAICVVDLSVPTSLLILSLLSLSSTASLLMTSGACLHACAFTVDTSPVQNANAYSCSLQARKPHF